MDCHTEKRATASQVGERLSALREAMQAHQLDAYLVPSADEHLNEYLPPNKERRAWISGFTGSAGDCLITHQTGWVFVDSRYYEQADSEIPAEHLQASKLGMDGHPSLVRVLQDVARALPEGQTLRLGFDPFTVSVQQYQTLEKQLQYDPVSLCPVEPNLVDPLWHDRPQEVQSEVFALPVSVTGQAWQEKIQTIQSEMKTHSVDLLPVTKLDQLAWLLNLRGQDIPYNPVFTAYALITPTDCHVFLETHRVRQADWPAYVPHLTVHPYSQYSTVLQSLSPGCTALIDPKHTTIGTHRLIVDHGGQCRPGEHPVERLKALKNETELRLMREANLKASRGKIRAWHWLDQQLQAGSRVTEASFRDAIESFYAEEDGFMGLSFNTIAGAGANSSIVHYGTPDPNQALLPGELFLIDSGCQFMGGTTDDTRTWLIGEHPSDLQTFRYTEVLKAHINCAMQQFPKGTEGARLDGVTRSTLWQSGLDYGHGTGHGVGAFLNVHEGPNGISKLAQKALEPGMINSIEPGYYEPGWGGIRLENLAKVVIRQEDPHTGQWLGFEPLTFIPFEPKLIDWSRLSAEQYDWLQGYNQQILEQIGPTLPPKERAWLERQCTLPPR